VAVVDRMTLILQVHKETHLEERAEGCLQTQVDKM